MIRRPPRSTLFPSRRSSDLAFHQPREVPDRRVHPAQAARRESGATAARQARRDAEDRKSTRLNPSHSQISYSVFCLKKQKRTVHHTTCHTPHAMAAQLLSHL